MKIFLLAFSLFFSVHVNGQDEKSFASLGYKTVMYRLFDKVVFNSENEALWKPNYSERLNMLVSDDGYCHTRMDTTMFYTSGATKHAVMIFATYNYYQGERSSCHVCAPILSIATFTKEFAGDWQIKLFKKDFMQFGSWGERNGSLGIEKLRNNFYCLKAKWAIDGNQGYFRGFTAYYSLNWYEQLKEVFSFVYYDSNEGALGEGMGFTEETAMKILHANEDFSRIELSTKRTDKKSIEKKLFKYSEVDGRFMLINN